MSSTSAAAVKRPNPYLSDEVVVTDRTAKRYREGEKKEVNNKQINNPYEEPQVVADKQDISRRKQRLFVPAIKPPPPPPRVTPPVVVLSTQPTLVPAMEWWDVPYLPKDMRDSATRLVNVHPDNAPYDKLKLSNQKSSLHVEHPVPIKPTAMSMISDVPLKIFRTKEENKRARRQARAVKNQEKRDLIAVGLMPPPPPKVKISNLLRVLGEQHTLDPSAVEARVKEEVDTRKKLRDASNQAKKLTPLERHAKRLRKIAADASKGTFVLVFRLSNLSTPEDLAMKRQALMASTARKLGLCGRIIIPRQEGVPTLVIVEGGPKGTRKFAKMMLKRINWKAKTLIESMLGPTGLHEDHDSVSGDDDNDNDDDVMDVVMGGGGGGGGACDCYLVWKGETNGRSYDLPFKVEVVDGEDDAKQFLARKQQSHYWDMAMAFNPQFYNTKVALGSV